MPSVRRSATPSGPPRHADAGARWAPCTWWQPRPGGAAAVPADSSETGLIIPPTMRDGRRPRPRMAGATRIVAVDPAPYNREKATVFGATHTFASAAKAAEAIADLTWGRMAESAIITVDVVTPTILADG